MDDTNINRMLEKAYDAYAPREIARLVQDVGVNKVNLPALQTLTLAMLAGAFIAFGGTYYTMVVTESGLGFGPTRMLGGLAFSFGLILIIIGGAQLFTGNTLIVMAWAEGRVATRRLLRNWTLVYCGNFAGGLGSAFFVHWSGALSLGDGAVGETAVHVATAKAELDVVEAFFRALLCNALVCLATWLSFAAREVAGKILAILFPVSAFVALGFEHSGANMT
jgi:formate/nitrite transporter